MKVAVIGATGNAGSRIAAELLRRKHEVTGIARNPEKLAAQPGLTMKKGDVSDEAGMAALLKGHDAVIHSVRFLGTNVHKVLGAVKKAGVPRLLVVGGAGSLEVSPGVALIDTPGFPAMAKGEAGAGREFLTVLRTEKELNWTFLSPSASFAPGERTGKFRLAKDELLTGVDGQSRITMEDYAIALVDEVEKPKYPRARFTVGY
jgi:hypothetical protein